MRRPSGQGPAARLFNGLAFQVEPASRAARAHRPSPARPARARSAIPAANRAPERQRPPPPGNPQPRAKFSGQRDRPGEKAFQVNRARRCADLRKRTSLTSGTALGGRCTTHASRAPERYAGSERDDWRSPQYSSTTTWKLSGSSAGTPSDNAVITGLSNLLFLFSSRTAMPSAPPGSRPRSSRADDAGA
jgi:hypothetical protein